MKPKWQKTIRNSFTEEEKSAPFGATVPATPSPSASTPSSPFAVDR